MDTIGHSRPLFAGLGHAGSQSQAVSRATGASGVFLGEAVGLAVAGLGRSASASATLRLIRLQSGYTVLISGGTKFRLLILLSLTFCASSTRAGRRFWGMSVEMARLV